jgi:hypothetical protein
MCHFERSRIESVSQSQMVAVIEPECQGERKVNTLLRPLRSMFIAALRRTPSQPKKKRFRR